MHLLGVEQPLELGQRRVQRARSNASALLGPHPVACGSRLVLWPRPRAAPIQPDHSVGRPRERLGVRDEDRRTALHQAAQAVHQLRLALGVEARRGLVEHEDRRIAQQRARDADALALAAGEAGALRPELGVIALRQLADELVRRRRARGPLDLLVARLDPVGDVLAHAAGEQDGVLEHDRHLLAHPGQRAVAHVAAVDRRRALRRVVEARDERAERRLAGARGAHDRHARAGRHVQRDIAQRGPLVSVAERHAVERDVPACAAASMGVRALLEHVVLGEQLGDAVRARHPRGDLGDLARHAAHRVVRLARVGDEHDQLSGADRAGGHAQHAGHEHQRRARRAHRADEPVEARLQPRDLDARGHPLLAALAHAV